MKVGSAVVLNTINDFTQLSVLLTGFGSDISPQHHMTCPLRRLFSHLTFLDMHLGTYSVNVMFKSMFAYQINHLSASSEHIHARAHFRNYISIQHFMLYQNSNKICRWKQQLLPCRCMEMHTHP